MVITSQALARGVGENLSHHRAQRVLNQQIITDEVRAHENSLFPQSPNITRAAPGAIAQLRRVHANLRAAMRCSASRASKSSPTTALSTTRQTPFTITRSALCAPQSTSAEIGS